MLIGTGIYARYYDWHRERKIASAFDLGAVPEPDVANLVEREEIARQIASVLQPPLTYNKYSIIVGYHGVGKTTLVRHVSHKLSGVLYVDVEADATSNKDFGTSMSKALNWTPRGLGWVRLLLERLNLTQPLEHSKLYFFFISEAYVQSTCFLFGLLFKHVGFECI